MAFSYQTVNFGFKTHKLRSVLIVVSIAMSFYAAGIFSTSAVAAYDANQLDKACRSYVELILGGKLEEAYDTSATTIQDAQTVEDYKLVLDKLKTDTPELSEDLHDVKVLDSKSGACAINVNGLPAADGERSDALFNMGVVKDGRNWKVASVSVE